MKLLPPGPGRCPVCASTHSPTDPHNATSLYYQYRFFATRQRWPTWADAVAHCSAEVCAHWRTELQSRGQWSEPDEGVEICADPPAECISQVVDFVDADGDPTQPVSVATQPTDDAWPTVSREMLAGQPAAVRAIAEASLDAILSARATQQASARDVYSGAMFAAVVAGLWLHRRGTLATVARDAAWLNSCAWQFESGFEAAIVAFAASPPAVAQATSEDKVTQLMLAASQILQLASAHWGASHAHAASACIHLVTRYVLFANHVDSPGDEWTARVVHEVADLVVRRVAEVQRGEAT